MIIERSKFEEELRKKLSPRQRRILTLEELEIYKDLKGTGILKESNYTDGDLAQTIGFFDKIASRYSAQNPKTVVYHRTPGRIKPRLITHQAHPFVEQIRKYYFNNYYSEAESPEKPPFTKEKADAWIKENVDFYGSFSFSSLPMVLIKTSRALTEDISGLAKTTGWREPDTLWHVLTGQIPKVFEYRIARYEYKYRGPITEEEFSRNWVSIQIDIENLTFEIMRKAYVRARKMFSLSGKRVISTEEQDFIQFVDKRLKDTKAQTKKESWEEIRKFWIKKYPQRIWKDWNAPRIAYKRIKKRMKTSRHPKKI